MTDQQHKQQSWKQRDLDELLRWRRPSIDQRAWHEKKRWRIPLGIFLAYVLLAMAFGAMADDSIDAPNPEPANAAPADPGPAPVAAPKPAADPEPEPKPEPEDQSTLASIMCEDFVKDRLQAPATAGFPGIWDQQIDVVNADRQRYRVRSHVDAENGFGAQIRAKYVCDVRNVGGDEWRLIDLQFTE